MNNLNPPQAKEVAKRLLVLKAGVVHAISAPPREMLAEWMRKWPSSEKDTFEREAKEQCQKTIDGFISSGLWEEFSPLERRFFSSTIADMTGQDQVNFSWRMEALVVVMWALRFLHRLPSIDHVSGNDLLREIPSSVLDFVNEASLRAHKEIDDARDLIELWHWRSRTRQLIERGDSPSPGIQADAKLGFHTYDDIVRFTAKSAHKSGKISKILDDDFVVKGKPFRDLNDAEWATVRSIIKERHFALNWLCGYAPDNNWDNTPTDT